VAGRYERLKFLLAHARRTENGRIEVDLPEPSPALKQRIQEAVRQEFQRMLARKNRIRATIEELIEDLFAPGDFVPEGVAVGYYARRPGTKERPRQTSSRRRQERICERTAVLLETIMNPELSDAERLKVLDRLIDAAGMAESKAHRGHRGKRSRKKRQG
jgi:hypothetical protein